jgi:hypothetical protein
MGSDAELVVLTMGLAIRDIAAIHFVEDDEYPPDFPAWVQRSSFELSDSNRLLSIWGKHLVTISNDPPNDSGPKGKGNGTGKGKNKGTSSRKKRNIQSPDNDAQGEEKQPP